MRICLRMCVCVLACVKQTQGLCTCHRNKQYFVTGIKRYLVFLLHFKTIHKNRGLNHPVSFLSSFSLLCICAHPGLCTVAGQAPPPPDAAQPAFVLIIVLVLFRRCSIRPGARGARGTPRRRGFAARAPVGRVGRRRFARSPTQVHSGAVRWMDERAGVGVVGGWYSGFEFRYVLNNVVANFDDILSARISFDAP